MRDLFFFSQVKGEYVRDYKVCVSKSSVYRWSEAYNAARENRTTTKKEINYAGAATSTRKACCLRIELTTTLDRGLELRCGSQAASNAAHKARSHLERAKTTHKVDRQKSPGCSWVFKSHGDIVRDARLRAG